jgi:hypothetical protein
MLLWLLQQLLFLQFTEKLLLLLLLKLHLHGPLHLSATPLWQYYNLCAAALLLMHAYLLLLLNYVRSELSITNCAILIKFGAKEPSKSEKEGSQWRATYLDPMWPLLDAIHWPHVCLRVQSFSIFLPPHCDCDHRHQSAAFLLADKHHYFLLHFETDHCRCHCC